MTDQPIKVTDYILHAMYHTMDRSSVDMPDADAYLVLNAIRELRNRARAVIEARIATRNEAVIMPLELCMALDKLMEVLP